MNYAIQIVVLALALLAATADAADDQQLLVMMHAPAPHYHPGVPATQAYHSPGAHVQARRLAEAVARDHGLKMIDGWPMPVLAVHCFLMSATNVAVAKSLETMQRDSRIESVSRLKHYQTLAMPTQPLDDGGDLDRAALHLIGTGDGVRIAQIDTGVELDHPALVEQIKHHENFLDAEPFPVERHGTAVAGIIAAQPNQGLGAGGIAPDARILALRACVEDDKHIGHCTSFSIAKALHFAIEADVDIINMSLGGPPDSLLARLLEVALSRQITVVGAHDPNRTDGGFPASHPRVLAAHGIMHGREHAALLGVPARDLLTTLPGGRWGFVSGSSLAAAQVSALSALVVSNGESVTAAGIAALLNKHRRRLSQVELSVAQACRGADDGCGNQSN